MFRSRVLPDSLALAVTVLAAILLFITAVAVIRFVFLTGWLW